MTSRNRLFAIVTLPICAAILLAGAWFARAGDLNPPAGPVLPTHKTLTEVEPRIAINATNTPGDADSLFKITQRGSYYLTGNITGVVGKHGIEIASGGVTLDLNGFDLVGVAAMGAFDGVSTTVANLSNIAVVNGSVRSWGDEGVDLGTLTATNCRVEGVLARVNAGIGISTGSGTTISNCSASLSTSHGINAGSGCTVSNCSAASNTGNGISTGDGCTVTNCSAYLNTGHGISASGGCTVSNCSADDNTSNGINALNGCTVSNCSAYANNDNGISAALGCTVVDCTVQYNRLDGIACANDCVIRGNTCYANGNGGDGAGIHATASDNRIEGNHCSGADRGIDVDFAGNFIIRNTCSGATTNWDIVIGNAVAPIWQASTNAAAISGNTYAGSLGSTDPNANFTY
jgi:parallel beta-helix repeat protein